VKRKLRVFRYNPETDTGGRFQTFELEAAEGMTVLDALHKCKEEQDGTLTFRWSCRSFICGSCAMTINGRNGLACKTQLSDLRGAIRIEPLAGMHVIKDLVVDWEPSLAAYRSITPHLIADDDPPETERIQLPEARRRYDAAATCILCFACTSSCPVGWTAGNYLGPAALTKVARFVEDDRDTATDRRLQMIADENGVWRCRTAFRCSDSCPKDIDTTGTILRLRRRIAARTLRRNE